MVHICSDVPGKPTARLVCELKAKGHNEGEHTFDKRFAVAKQLHGGRFVLKIDGDGAVFPSRSGAVSHSHPHVRWLVQLMTQDEENASQFQEDREGVGALPLPSMECGHCRIEFDPRGWPQGRLQEYFSKNRCFRE
jgi:hypothetical protein